MDELQSDISVEEISDTELKVKGKLLNIEEPWTEFSKTGANTGHFLSMVYQPKSNPESAVTFQISNGDVKNAVKIDPSDHIGIMRVKSNDQVITVREYTSGKVTGKADYTYTMDLSGLTLEE